LTATAQSWLGYSHTEELHTAGHILGQLAKAESMTRQCLCNRWRWPASLESDSTVLEWGSSIQLLQKF